MRFYIPIPSPFPLVNSHSFPHPSSSLIHIPIFIRFPLGYSHSQTGTQCLIKMGAFDAAVLGPFKK